MGKFSLHLTYLGLLLLLLLHHPECVRPHSGRLGSHAGYSRCLVQGHLISVLNPQSSGNWSSPLTARCPIKQNLPIGTTDIEKTTLLYKFKPISFIKLTNYQKQIKMSSQETVKGKNRKKLQPALSNDRPEQQAEPESSMLSKRF